MEKKVYVAAVALLASVVVSDANAGRQIRENDAQDVLAAPVSLIQAITIAENELSGKASHGEIEISDGKLIYEIEIVTENRVMDVEVDARNGQLISSKRDKIDSDENDMEEQDEDNEEKAD